MEEKNTKYRERLERLRYLINEVDGELLALAHEGGDIRRDITRFLDETKLRNISKIIEKIN